MKIKKWIQICLTSDVYAPGPPPLSYQRLALHAAARAAAPAGGLAAPRWNNARDRVKIITSSNYFTVHAMIRGCQVSDDNAIEQIYITYLKNFMKFTQVLVVVQSLFDIVRQYF